MRSDPKNLFQSILRGAVEIDPNVVDPYRVDH